MTEAGIPLSDLRERLIELLEPLLAQVGYELVELEFGGGPHSGMLRIFIDQPTGIAIEDCERVSREVSAALDAHDPIPGAYRLEVSSPGFDRVLRTKPHFLRFVGERVNLELRLARAGRRRYTGLLRQVIDTGIEIEVDQQIVNIPFAEIGKARLAPLEPARQ